jgi:hypothetical protein
VEFCARGRRPRVALAERQIEIAPELERDGHEMAAETARELLLTFQKTQVSQVTDRDRLRAELAALT